jgi:mycofactocin system FadH/OYE family oxidoreductase 2
MTTSTQPGVQFKHLFTPLKIGTFEVRNRIVSTAHFTGYGDRGLPSERHMHYWGSKAKGGIGLIVTEVQPVHPSAGQSPTMILTWRDDVIEPFKRVADYVHQYGARIVAQLWHPGRQGGGAAGFPSWAPSPIPYGPRQTVPHEMTMEEVQEVIAAYGPAARRMREAGADGVEIHAAHGYLPQQFLSPLTNKRSDGYGGTEENRVRFLMEIIDAVRDAVGNDYTVGIRVSGDEYQQGGLSLQDMQRIVGTLNVGNKLDYINVSFSGGPIIAPMYVPSGQFVYLAAGIKQVTDVPVFCIGRINDPVLAENILAQNQADMVGMTRANICDPELPNKAREGRLNEIRRCVAISEGCWGHVSTQQPITCVFNPTVGREKETQITPALVKKKVMVIGGGIAGMEAARVAAARGHHVSLYEKQPYLGGQLQIAAKAPGRQDMTEPVRYYEYQFKLLGVDVHLGEDVDPEMVQSANPEAVILATGGRPRSLPIRGASGPNVMQARDVLMGLCEPGDNVLLFAADQGMEGLTTADFLAARGKQVQVLIPQATLGGSIDPLTTMMLNRRLEGAGVKIQLETRLEAIDGSTVTVVRSPGDLEQIEDVDTVVIALGSEANDELYKQIRKQVNEVLLVGECFLPRKLEHHTLDGLLAGLKV